MHATLPLVEELTAAPDPVAAFQCLSGMPFCLFLDSARRDRELGRYSFLCADPFQVLCDSTSPDPLARLQHLLAPFPATTVPGLPPFQGGAAGLFAYDLNRTLERVPAPQYDEFQLPRIALGIYDTVLAYDHAEQRTWLISQGFPELDQRRRQARAAARLKQFRNWLNSRNGLGRPAEISGPARLAATQLAPQYSTAGPVGLTSNFSHPGYCEMVERAREYIYAGDLFQVNLAQRLLYPGADHPAALYVRLRERNPAPFAGYFDAGEFQIASASPERFVRSVDGHVETRPIKGTRPRTARPEADLFAADELQSSEKDRAENVMIVDLLRNDLSRVCRPDSIHVPQLCRLEAYQFVQHLVSVVEGQLEQGRTPLDLLRAAFPGGSITGAPKVRAMEIIAELERTARGAYCGSLGYLGFDGSLDSSILIRTITAARGWWQMPVGGGIVAQSVPQREYDETWDKARGLIQALQP